jgi:hypothetical protein
MGALAASYDPAVKPGLEVRIKQAAVKIWHGGAVAVILGTGYATPLVPATAGHRFQGVAEETVDNATGAAGDKSITLRRAGICYFNQSGLTLADIGKKAYFSDDNTVTTTPGNILAGEITDVNAAGLVGVDIGPGVRAGLATSLVQIAAGTALTASSTETALGTQTIPANSLKAGDRIKIRFQGIATATNSTDTLTIKAYIGGITGTALISMAAQDVANNDVFVGEYELVVRTSGASGTIVGVGTFKSIPAAEGTMTIKDDILASTAIDTTAAQAIAVSGTWSTTNAGNSCRLDILNVDIIRA